MYTTERPSESGQLWRVVVHPYKHFYGEVSLGNMTQYKIFAYYVTPSRLFVGIEGRGCYRFDGFVHMSYAMEKLNLLYGDAANVSDWINYQLQIDNLPIQGRYDRSLMRENDL